MYAKEINSKDGQFYHHTRIDSYIRLPHIDRPRELYSFAQPTFATYMPKPEKFINQCLHV